MGLSNHNFFSRGLLFTWDFVHLFYETATLPPLLWQVPHHLAHMLLPVSLHLGEGTHGPICQVTCLYSFIQRGEICFTINVCILGSNFFFNVRKKKRERAEKNYFRWSTLKLCAFAMVLPPNFKRDSLFAGRICAKVWGPGLEQGWSTLVKSVRSKRVD